MKSIPLTERIQQISLVRRIRRSKKTMMSKVLPMALFLVSMFFVGRAVGYAVSQANSRMAKVMEMENWGLGFGREGTQPTGNATAAQLKAYDTYYIGNDSDKVIYLTFDCGYENGNTAPILDALKKHEAHATFFVVGHFLKTAPDNVKRMIEEGHTVGNHTYNHPDISAVAGWEEFKQEMEGVENLFREITGRELTKYYRPPQGKYNLENLRMAKKMGYSTFFWSLAYVDWLQDEQPTREGALEKLQKRVHPGAVVLLHCNSRTNGEIMDELLAKWEEMGYTFRPLSDLTGATVSAKEGDGGKILQEYPNR
jgi:peptidoglycan-N-acetylmuramic acid deacetylase